MNKIIKKNILIILIIVVLLPIKAKAALTTSSITTNTLYYGAAIEYNTSTTETYRYNFTLTSASRVYVEFISDMGFLYARLVNASTGTQLALYSPTSYSEVWYSEELDLYNGNYYLEVERKVSTNVSLPYSFIIHTKAYGSGTLRKEAFGDIPLNKNYSESRYISGIDQSVFKKSFYVNDTGVANIKVSNNIGEHGVVSLLSKSGASMGKASFSEDMSIEFNNILLNEGEYYLQIESGYLGIVFTYDVFIEFDRQVALRYSYPYASTTLKVGNVKKITYDSQIYEGGEWKSSNNLIASTTPEGLITAHKEGTVSIVLKDSEDNDIITYIVTVITGNSDKIQKLVLNTSRINLSSTQRYQLTAYYIPSNIANMNLQWTSINSNIAEVSSSGIITALSAGSTIITVEDKVTGKVAACQVVVEGNLDFDSEFEEMYVSNYEAIIEQDDVVQLEMASSLSGNVSWYSTEPDIAIVDNNGNVTGISPGNAVIIAYTNSNTNSNMIYYHLTVENIYFVERIKLDSQKLTMYTGDTYKLKANALPAQAGIRTVSYKSSDSKVVKVNKNGKLTALKTGKATITVTANDGSKVKAKCVITVKN